MFVKTMQQAKRVIKIVIGFTLLALSIVGWALPVISGWAFLIAGLAILAAEFVWARRLLDRIKAQGARVRDAVMPKSASRKAAPSNPTVD